MPLLLIHEGTYYSPLDEAAFFSWLGSISGVCNIRGTPEGLQITLRTRNLSERALRDLIAIHWRYKLPMKDLQVFESEKNRSWFCNPASYWFEAVFGESALPANMEVRLAELRESGVSPVKAIKTISNEYKLSLGEVKRRLSSSPSWANFAAASAGLQEEAIAIASNATGRV